MRTSRTIGCVALWPAAAACSAVVLGFFITSSSGEARADPAGCPDFVVDMSAPLPPPEPILTSEVVQIGPGRSLLVDGEPFFAIGMYGLEPDVYDEAADAGFNVAHSYTRCCDGDDLEAQLKFLSDVAAAGLRGMLYPFYPQSRIYDYSQEEIETYLSARADVPGLLAWYNFDEPTLNNVDPQLMEDFHDVMQMMEPRHPDSIVDVPLISQFWSYRHQCDIQMVDPYPYPLVPPVYVSISVHNLVNEAAPGQPTWAVLQAHDQLPWVCEDTPELPQCKDLEPSPGPPIAYMRNNTFQALSAGATGILYWSYHGSRYNMADWPAHWEGLKAIVTDVAHLIPVLLSDDVTNLVSSDPARAVEVPFRVFRTGQDMVVVATNATVADQSITLDFARTGQNFCVGDVMEGGNWATLEGSQVQLTMGPLQAKVIQVSPWSGARSRARPKR